MKNLFLLFTFIAAFANTHAQYNDLAYYRQAEQYFAGKDYLSAVSCYEKYLTVDRRTRPMAQPFAIQKIGHTTGSPRVLATCHLAIAYLQLHNFQQAEKYWLKAASFDRKEFPEYGYWYGRTLMSLGKYEEASKILTEFEKEYTKMGQILLDADLLLADLRFIQDQQKWQRGPRYDLQRISDSRFTTVYAMGVHGEDSSYFTGVRSQPPYQNELYFVNSNAAPSANGNASLSAASPFTAASANPRSPAAPSPVQHQGLASFTPDGSTLFFTRWTDSAGTRRAAIWTQKHQDSGWSAATPLNDLVNLTKYNSTQPFVTTDGKHLLFSSDRPGGYGGYDLWYADLDSNYNIIATNNLGAIINTAGDEQCPYYHHRNHILVFASNGRIGMGGYDLYYAKGYFNLFKWEEPVNPGSSLNSTRDDMYYYSLDDDNVFNKGWMSSDRDSGCCLALYTVRQNNHQRIAGQVIDSLTGKPVADVRLQIKDQKQQEITDPILTDSEGNYHFALSNISRFRLTLTHDGYDTEQQDYVISLQGGEDSVQNDPIYLKNPVAIAKAIAQARSFKPSVLGNWPYKQSALPAPVRKVLDSLISVLQQEGSLCLQVEGYTDGIGSAEYNLRLSQQRIDGCLHYLLKKGLSPNRLIGKAMGKCCPIAPDTIEGKDNPAGREKNRRVEYRLIPKQP